MLFQHLESAPKYATLAARRCLMTKHKPRIGKKGGAKRVAQELTRIRETPLSKRIFEIVDESYSQKSVKKSAKPSSDLGV
jgi:hypothetical protein